MARRRDGLWVSIALIGAAIYGAVAASADKNRPVPRLTPQQAWRRAFSRNSDITWVAPEPQAKHRHQSRPGEHLPVDYSLPTEDIERARLRGRFARYPWQFSLAAWWMILKRVWDGLMNDHLGLIAAGVAFYSLLALFPSLLVAVAVVGLFASPADLIEQLTEISHVLPDDAAEMIMQQAVDVASRDTSGLGLTAFTGLAVALYSSSRAIMSMIEGINVAYDEDEKRGFFRINLVGFGLTLFLIVGGLLGIMSTVVAPTILAKLHVEPGLFAWFDFLRWPILVVGTMVGLCVLYRYGPSRKRAQWLWLMPGAVAAGLVLLIGTAGFGWYVANLASYNKTFGALGGVAVLMMWLWISAFIILLGAELNAEIEAQTAEDTTTGRKRPMGLRGAVKADTIGAPID